MKKILLLSCSLLISTNSFAASREVDKSSHGFSLVRGVKSAAIGALSVFTPEVEAASIRKTSKELGIVPDGFPVFVKYDGYFFDPSKLNYISITPTDIVYLTFQAGGTISFPFNSTETANQFVNDMLFANILDLDSSFGKK